MKRVAHKLFILFGALSCIVGSAIQAEYERPIVVVIASYNNANIYRLNINSVFMQKYTNYKVIYIDDASPDGTGKMVQEYINEIGQNDRYQVILNQERQGALANQYRAITSCEDHTIIVNLDGDDMFAHPDVLLRINETYADPNVWLTYGQFIEYPSGHKGFCHPMPESVIQHNGFRAYQDLPSHLRTFYAGLFKKINVEDLMLNGKFLPMTGDLATMIPMIEMAGERFKFIPEILYIYNASNPINDHKVSRELQYQMDIEIRSRSRYARLEKLFSDERNAN